MRQRRVVTLMVTAILVSVGAPSPAAAQTSQAPNNDPGRGLVYSGLRRSSPGSLCRGNFELEHRDVRSRFDQTILCTHGPDPAPEGVDVRQRRQPLSAVAASTTPSGGVAAQSTIPCYGDGSDGYRVHMIYARASNVADRFSSYAGSFVQWAAQMDATFNNSAVETGGTRHVRFLTDAGCNLIIDRVTLSTTGDDNFDNTIKELRSKGYTRYDRKYVVWVDANVYCGIGQIYGDDRADPTPGVNYNNGHTRVQGEVSRIDNGCWGLSASVEAHELMHNLGGVQPGAPNATPGFHCTDDYDRMCYRDGSTSVAMQYPCATSGESRFDCRHDDYFSTAPVAGGWLATHWNSADSVFLSSAPPSSTAPTTTTAPPTTTTTVPATTTTTAAASTTTTAPSLTTTAPPAVTTTVPPGGTVPSVPRNFFASQPVNGKGVVLAWKAPASGPVTGYRIYRGGGTTQTLLATVDNVTSFLDSKTTSGVLYYYKISAYNAAGEGPFSPLTRMIAK